MYLLRNLFLTYIKIYIHYAIEDCALFNCHEEASSPIDPNALDNNILIFRASVSECNSLAILLIFT